MVKYRMTGSNPERDTFEPRKKGGESWNAEECARADIRNSNYRFAGTGHSVEEGLGGGFRAC